MTLDLIAIDLFNMGALKLGKFRLWEYKKLLNGTLRIQIWLKLPLKPKFVA